PLARATPGCHSRNTSGERGATMAGSAVNAPRLRSVLARWRASYSFFTGQQKATRLRASPGNERAIKPSMRSRQESSCAGESARRAVIKRSRCVFRHVFRVTASTCVLSFASMISNKILGASVALWLAAAPAFAGNSSDDLEVRWYGWASRLQRGDESAYAEAAAAMWLEPRELPEGCSKLADAMIEEGQLTLGDVWRRVRVLFEYGQITAAKTALGYLPRNEAPDERMLAEAARQPKRLLSRLPRNLEHRATREVVVLAVVRFARSDAEGAAAALDGPLAARLPEPDLKYLWGRVGHEAARE